MAARRGALTPPRPRLVLALAAAAAAARPASSAVLLANATYDGDGGADAGTVPLPPPAAAELYGPVWLSGRVNTTVTSVECWVYVPQAGSPAVSLYLFDLGGSAEGGGRPPAAAVAPADGTLLATVTPALPASPDFTTFARVTFNVSGAAATALGQRRFYGLGVAADAGAGAPPELPVPPPGQAAPPPDR